jgi:hypothetical protein
VHRILGIDSFCFRVPNFTPTNPCGIIDIGYFCCSRAALSLDRAITDREPILGIFKKENARSSDPRPNLRASVPKTATRVAPGVTIDSFGIVRAEPQVFDAPRPLTAAAAQVNLQDKGEAELFRARRQSASTSWQSEAWEYYDSIGEIKYAFNLVASVVSRIRLYAAAIQNPSEAPAPIDAVTQVDGRLAAAAQRALDRLSSAYGGQPGLLKDAALNIQVAGECYLVQIPERVGSGLPETWDIRSVDELQVDSRGNYIINPRRDVGGGVPSTMSQGNKEAIALPKGAFAGRIWRAHPRYSQESDSSLRGLLDLCGELLLLNRTFRATARSRLNAGALYLPDGLSVAASPDPDYPYDEEGNYNEQFNPEEAADDFEDQLIDAMLTPIKDEDSASAVVPLIIRGPAELGDKIKQFKFERSFDATLVQRADRVLERIMQGLDVPKDVVTGLANVKYSNALQIDEALYKAHIEPLMLLIVDALTVVYLRPYLIANGYAPDEVKNICIWYDPSLVATRNDRASDADMGFDKMAVSFDAWRRAHGFSEADAPDPKEFALRLIMSKGMITPELTEAVLASIAPDIMNQAREVAQEATGAPIPDDIDAMLQQAAGPAAGAETTEAPAAQPAATPLAEPEV